MEIINPDNLPGNNARGCNTEALAPNHECYTSGGGCTMQCYESDPCVTNFIPTE